jgi:hypothetical protein
MKISVLVPGETYRHSAGARIRYGRLVAPLATHGIELELCDIGNFDLSSAETDALVICKCHDARAPLLAIAAHRSGVPVGVDLFDDYFSQADDVRLVRFRQWLNDLSPWLSFILTSTQEMADVAAQFVSKVPVQILHDVAAQGCHTTTSVGAGIEAKLRRTVDEQRLTLAWFGMGDNPYFPVGWTDISAFAGELATLGRLAKMAIELTILTNERSLTPQGLSLLAKLPINAKVRAWSEDAEVELLSQSFACYLPVNAQSFSRAKSLNRAVTALSSGSQILSLGYPLYAPLESFIYRDVEDFATDLGLRKMRLSSNRYEALIGKLDELASAERESVKLAKFLTIAGKNKKSGSTRIAVVHGANTTKAINELARTMAEPTIGSPYAPPLSVDHIATVSNSLEVALTESRRPSPKSVRPGNLLDLAKAPLSVQVALYPTVMQRLSLRLASDLGAEHMLVSENSPIPYLLPQGGRKL